MNYKQIPSPSYVLDERLLRKNLELIANVQKRAGVSVILAFKGFAMWSTFPLVREYLKGATASSLNEARLCFEEMKQKAHTYAPAYAEGEFEEIMQYSSHITFNSIAQYQYFKSKVQKNKEAISCGIRVNPEYSPVETEMYNPCAVGSRLGEMYEAFTDGLPQGIEGLHFHALCESGAEDLEKVLENFEERFGNLIPQLKWINMGGGHLMTRNGYDIEKLISVLKVFKSKYDIEIILEPGSAIAWETGVLVASVLDVMVGRGVQTAILDVSFTAHMPDTLEMPYRPRVIGAIDPENEDTLSKYLYRLGGVSCLAGDFHYEYGFDKELKVGDRLVFEDMIHYTMVKTTTFNGVTHPNIAIWHEDDSLEIVKKFGYEDFKNRLS